MTDEQSPRKRRAKAADITDEQLMTAIRAVRRPSSNWSLLGDIQEQLKAHPPKVVLAKLKRMVKNGKLDGCTCGCRGDFEEI